MMSASPVTFRRSLSSSSVIRACEDRWFDRFRRTGDPRALAKVFDRTAPELWRVAAHLCRDRHDAEDAVQGAFLAAIEDRNGWDPARPLLPWLLGLLANRVREQRRRAARVPDAQRIGSTGERDPAELAEHGEFGTAFRSALLRVAEPYRSAVERHLVHGVAAHEIAAELGAPPRTSRSAAHPARRSRSGSRVEVCAIAAAAAAPGLARAAGRGSMPP